MVQELKVFFINSDLAAFSKSVRFLEGLIEHIKEPAHTELIHLVDLVKLRDSKVQICRSNSDWSVHLTSLLQELIGVVDPLQFLSNCLRANLALFEDFNQFVILEKLPHIWR